MKLKEKQKALRIDRGLTQENLADAVHVSRSAIAKYENGNGYPSNDTLNAIAQYFNVDIDELEDDLEVKKINNNKKVFFTYFIYLWRVISRFFDNCCCFIH